MEKMKSNKGNNISNSKNDNENHDIFKDCFYDFLDKIRTIPYLTEELPFTVQQVANYYDCSLDTIKTLIKRNRD